MRKLNFVWSHIYLLALIMGLFMIVSCSDDNDGHGTGVIDGGFVGITSLGIDDGANVWIGGTLALSAQMEGVEGELSYQWTVDGEVVATTSDCTFTPGKEQQYTVGLVVKNDRNRWEKSITIQAVPYGESFYIVNEGQGNASVNLYNAGTLTTVSQDPVLGLTGTTGCLHGNKLYLVSKGAQLSCINAETGAVEKQLKTDGGQGSDFCMLDENTGVLSTTAGIYTVNLSDLSVNAVISTSRNCYDLFIADNHLFTLEEKSTIKVYSTDDFSLEKEISQTAVTGFAQTPDGTVWAATQNTLVKIDPSTLESEEVALPDGLELYYNPWAYTPTGLKASTTENALYFAQNVKEGFSTYGKDIYKYNVEEETATLFFSAPAVDKSVYGAGIQVNPSTGDIYLIYTEDGFGTHYLNTNIYVLDGGSGSQKAIVDYKDEYWFPSVLVFL